MMHRMTDFLFVLNPNDPEIHQSATLRLLTFSEESLRRRGLVDVTGAVIPFFERMNPREQRQLRIAHRDCSPLPFLDLYPSVHFGRHRSPQVEIRQRVNK